MGSAKSSLPGQSLIVPAGRLHGFRNSGTTMLHIHAVLASPVFEATPEGVTEVVRRWDGRALKRFRKKSGTAASAPR